MSPALLRWRRPALRKGLNNRSGLNLGVGLDSNRKAAKNAVGFQLPVQTQTQVRQGGRRVSGPHHS